MQPQCLFAVAGHLFRDFPRELGVDALRDEGRRELLLLFLRIIRELTSLDLDLGLNELVLAGDRRELAGGHRECAGDQAGHAGQDDVRAAETAAADTGDQADVGDEPVHRAEHCRAQPPTADIAMLVPGHGT